MIFDKFATKTLAVWDKYLTHISKAQDSGSLDSNGGSVLFPNILLVTNCSGFYVAELIGATNKYDGLKLKRHEEKSIYRYLSQFDDSDPDPLVHMDGKNHGFKFLCLAQEADFEAVKNRFPSIELYGSKLNRIGGKGSVFSFGENFESCSIENSILINRSEHLYRCKNILSAWIFKRSITKPSLNEYCSNFFGTNEVKGVHTVKSKTEEQLIVSGQLQSMYLFPSLRETTIGEFLNLHPGIIKKAFKTDHFEYEPYLEWKEHDGTCSDTAINPDFLVKRPDGFFDIYDIKNAVLTMKNVTRGGRRRRRFIDYVEEGIAQLANYQEYFSYPLNAQHAKEKYGVEIKNPKLVLVVGSWENSAIEEVKQACRRYPTMEVIDYDTFCHLFIDAT